ncbi:hypothetical protein MAPG_11469 [Magnaporthiopsis poae ATCC 64411]|uniref:Uncharacterized protein n=1 Tax=Magnaporthiopsis poae (strain ATCC 64411 / 73-15) TaxID=644358 RepID=A0A0C4EFC6_MAGP6|nr:hypothetical protein MAPG_11469 [Magnaporthiopsis poae ATCC 64411]
MPRPGLPAIGRDEVDKIISLCRGKKADSINKEMSILSNRWKLRPHTNSDLYEAALHPIRDQNSVSALFHAVGSGSLEVVKALVERWGFDVDALDATTGQTALMHAVARRRSLDMIELLAEHTDNLNKADLRGYKAVEIAAGNADPKLVNWFLTKGAAIQAKRQPDRTEEEIRTQWQEQAFPILGRAKPRCECSVM